MMKYYKITFFIFMIMGTLVTLSSYSWLSLWLGLEINMMSIIPLLTNTKNKFPTEAALKYFIAQVLASLIFLFSTILILTKNQMFNNIMNYEMIMLYSSIFLKMGAAPFHIWFPEVLEGLSWFNCMIMLTWQKIAPMIIMMNNFKLNTFIVSIIIMSLIFSSILGINQISMRKIMAYSSINHIAWMLSSMFQTKVIWMIYFLIYAMISIVLIYSFEKLKIVFITQINIKSNNMSNLILSANFFSLAGLPPFLGFLPKWLTINELILENNLFLSTSLIIFTLIPIYFYIRLSFTSLTFSSVESTVTPSMENKFLLMFLNLTIIFSLVFCTLILNSF